MSDAYEDQGFGQIAIGFGERPAILVVDFQLGFTSAEEPLGGSHLVDAAVEIPAVRTSFLDGTSGTQLDSRIYDADQDVIFRKIAPSIFFQTPAVQFLTKHRIDTVIIVGCNTSGCVRASAVDAFSYGYRTILPRDACGDVEEGPHDQALRDIDRRYGDVLTSNEVIAYLSNHLEAAS